VLEKVVSYGRRMLRDGLVLGTAGNISVRVSDGIVITPTSVPYEEIAPEELCILDTDGEQLAGHGRPSAETPMHLNIYSATDAAAVVHTHSPVAVAVSAVINELPAIHYAIHAFGGDTIRVVDYKRFGSDDLAGATVTALDGRRGVLLRNHGTVTYGRSLEEAYHLAVLLEWLATAYWRAKAIGEPNIISRAELDEVADEARRRRYGAGTR
jgi:L-fuculose-phosphate aldolase